MAEKQSILKHNRILFKLYRFWRDNFDAKRGLLGGVVMGTVIFFINYDHGFWPGFVAGMKQFVYTFIFGSIFIKLCFNLAVRFSKKDIAVIASAVIPSGMAILMTYGVHSLRGTPEPFHSTLPAILSAPFAFGIFGWRVRTRYDREEALRKKMERKRRKRNRKRGKQFS